MNKYPPTTVHWARKVSANFSMCIAVNAVFIAILQADLSNDFITLAAQRMTSAFLQYLETTGPKNILCVLTISSQYDLASELVLLWRNGRHRLDASFRHSWP